MRVEDKDRKKEINKEKEIGGREGTGKNKK